MVIFNFEFPEKLLPVLNTNKRYIVLKGGRSSGKSHFIARKMLADRLVVRRDLLCVRQYQKNLEQSNYKLIKNIINEYKLPYKIYADKFVSLSTESEIVFEGMNNVTQHNIKSYEGFHDAWIEEGQNFSRSSFQLLDPTLKMDGSKIYMSLYEDDEVLDEIQTVHPDRCLIIHINYLDNPFAPEEEKLKAAGYKKNKPEEYKHIYLGLPKSGGGLRIVKDWTKENERELPYLKDLPIVVGMDFNRNPMCWVLAHLDDESLYIFEEFVRENTWIRPSISELLDTYRDHEGGFIICGDSSGHQLRSEGEVSCFIEVTNEFIKRGYKQISAKDIRKGKFYNEAKQEYVQISKGKYFAIDTVTNPSRSARFNAFNNLVVNEHGKRNLFIDKSDCPWLYYNIKNLKQKPGSNEFDIPTIAQIRKDPTFINELQYLGHPYDAASYIVYRYFPGNLLYNN